MKLFVLNRQNTIIYLLLILFCTSLIAYNWNSAIAVFSGTKKDLPIYCVDRQDNLVSISFDAAWGNEDTEELISILNKYNVKTTFFVVGSWVDKYPQSVKALFDAGHEIMNHSNTHPHLTSLSAEKIKEETQKCDEKIMAITKVKPFLTRPPYGDYNDKVVGTLREIGHYTIQWDVDSLDWKDLSPEQMLQRIDNKVKSGSIVLFHNAAKNTPAALPKIIENIQGKGFKIVPISQIIYKDNFKIDHSGKQIPDIIQKTSLE